MTLLNTSDYAPNCATAECFVAIAVNQTVIREMIVPLVLQSAMSFFAGTPGVTIHATKLVILVRNDASGSALMEVLVNYHAVPHAASCPVIFAARNRCRVVTNARHCAENHVLWKSTAKNAPRLK
jgi:hypothetical protein